MAKWRERSLHAMGPRGQFLECPEKFSHLESHSKISKIMVTERFYSRIININSGSLHKRNLTSPFSDTD